MKITATITGKLQKLNELTNRAVVEAMAVVTVEAMVEATAVEAVTAVATAQIRSGMMSSPMCYRRESNQQLV
jgi:hypothetical protein